MANLTIAVDDELLKRARVKAIEEGTSVNAVLRERLEEYVDAGERQRRALDALLESARKSSAGSAGRKWTREELYERGRPR
jgi:hypothetical protein